jgi:hypothetical protein
MQFLQGAVQWGCTPHSRLCPVLSQSRDFSMPAFEDIAAADYDEPVEDLLEWIATSSSSITDVADSTLESVPDESSAQLHSDIHPSSANGALSALPQFELTYECRDWTKMHKRGQVPRCERGV